MKTLLTLSERNLQQLTRLNSEEIKSAIEAAAEIIVASKFTKGWYETYKTFQLLIISHPN